MQIEQSDLALYQGAIGRLYNSVDQLIKTAAIPAEKREELIVELERYNIPYRTSRHLKSSNLIIPNVGSIGFDKSKWILYSLVHSSFARNILSRNNLQEFVKGIYYFISSDFNLEDKIKEYLSGLDRIRGLQFSYDGSSSNIIQTNMGDIHFIETDKTVFFRKNDNSYVIALRSPYNSIDYFIDAVRQKEFNLAQIESFLEQLKSTLISKNIKFTEEKGGRLLRLENNATIGPIVKQKLDLIILSI